MRGVKLVLDAIEIELGCQVVYLLCFAFQILDVLGRTSDYLVLAWIIEGVPLY